MDCVSFFVVFYWYDAVVCWYGLFGLYKEAVNVIFLKVLQKGIGEDIVEGLKGKRDTYYTIASWCFIILYERIRKEDHEYESYYARYTTEGCFDYWS